MLGRFDANATEALQTLQASRTLAEESAPIDGATRYSPDPAFATQATSLGALLRFHSQLFANGTVCELTGAARSAEVRFVCATEGMQGIGDGGEPVLLSNYIESVKEPATCTYVLTFATPLLCESPTFRQEEAPVSHIRCGGYERDEREGAES